MEQKKNTNHHQSNKHLEQLIIESNPDAFKGVPKEKSKEIVRAVAISINKSHSGPIPDAETLSEYNNVIPDGANRIMIMAEKQSEHRIAMENKVISSQIIQSNLGQIFALIIGLFTIGVGAWCICSGYEFGGGFLGVGGVVGLVTAFIQGKNSQKKDLNSKKQ